MAPVIVITAANKLIYQARLAAITAGTKSTSVQKSRELAEVLEIMLTAVTATG